METTPKVIATRKKGNPSINMDKMPQAIISPSTTPRTRGNAIEQFKKTVTNTNLVVSPKTTRKSISSEENPGTPKTTGKPKKVQTPSRTSSRTSQSATNSPKTSTIEIVNSPRVRRRISRSNPEEAADVTVNSPRVSGRTTKATEKTLSSKPSTPKATTRKSVVHESPTTSLRNTPKRGKNIESEIEVIKTPIRKKQIENEKTPKTLGRKSPETPKSNLRRSRRSSTSTENTPKRGKNSETVESVKTPKISVKGNDNLRNSLRKNETAKNSPKRVVEIVVVNSPKENVRPSRSTTKKAPVVITRASRSISGKRLSSESKTRRATRSAKE